MSIAARFIQFFFLALCFVFGMNTGAYASDYPDRSVRLVVPYPPGASTDLAARLIAEHVSKGLGQAVVVENRPGASGSIGTQYVARQPADGYVFMLGTDPTHGTNTYLIPDQNFDPIEDFTPLGLLALNPILLTLNSEVPADTIEEYIELVKADKLSGAYGSSGLGSPHHLAGELLKEYSGAPLTHVPYRGGGPSVNDLLNNQIPAAFASVITVLPHIQSGKLKAIGVTDADRYFDLPDVPAIGEVFEGFDVPSWLAFFAPKGLPGEVEQTLVGAVQAAINDAEIKEKLIASGLVVPEDTSPQALAELQREDLEIKKKIILDSGIAAE